MVHWDMSTTPASRPARSSAPQNSIVFLRWHSIRVQSIPCCTVLRQSRPTYWTQQKAQTRTYNYWTKHIIHTWTTLLQENNYSHHSHVFEAIFNPVLFGFHLVEAWLSHRRGPVDFKCELGPQRAESRAASLSMNWATSQRDMSWPCCLGQSLAFPSVFVTDVHSQPDDGTIKSPLFRFAQALPL